jgi:hypothetical protein
MHFHFTQLPPTTHNSLPKTSWQLLRSPNTSLLTSLRKTVYVSTRGGGGVPLGILAPIPFYNDVTYSPIGLAAPSSRLGAEIPLLLPESRRFAIQVTLYFTVPEGLPSVGFFGQTLTMDLLFNILNLSGNKVYIQTCFPHCKISHS